MDDVYIYTIDLPPTIKETVTPCVDGYTVYINRNLDELSRLKALYHALSHITGGDFCKQDVQQIEFDTHLEDE